MVYVYFPCFLTFVVCWYWMQFSIIFSLFITPVAFLGINGFLIYHQKFNMIHGFLDKLIVFGYMESFLHKFVIFMVYLLFLVPYVNNIYSWLKIKVLLYVFNKITSFIPDQKTNELRSELQNDYMEILNRNRKKRTVSLVNSELTSDINNAMD